MKLEKTSIWVIYQAASIMNQDHYLSADENEYLLVLDQTPETVLLKKNSLECSLKNLSDEAKELINIILYAPNEMADILISPTGRRATGEVVKRQLTNRMSQQWGDLKAARRVIKEIEDFIKSL